MVFHQDDKNSRMQLSRLMTIGLLQQKGDAERYKLNHFLYRQVVRTLKTQNIIH